MKISHRVKHCFITELFEKKFILLHVSFVISLNTEQTPAY